MKLIKGGKFGDDSAPTGTEDYYDDTFTLIFGIVDSAITGAFIAGLDAGNVSTLVSFLFFQYASERFENSEEVFIAWMADVEVWEKVKDSVRLLAGEIAGQAVDRGELKELAFLKGPSGIKLSQVSELEDQRNSKRAIEIGNWITSRVAEAGRIETIIAELAVLTVWCKFDAAFGQLHQVGYAAVRQNPPLLLEAYGETLAEAAGAI